MTDPRLPGGRTTCPHCGEDFIEADHRDLHVGRAHTEAMDADEWLAFEAARDREDAWLERYARHMRAGLTTLPIVLAWLGTIVLILVMDANPAFVVMFTPGVAAFGAIVYYMSYTSRSAPDTG